MNNTSMDVKGKSYSTEYGEYTQSMKSTTRAFNKDKKSVINISIVAMQREPESPFLANR